jgi:hypothetical protein
VLDQFRSITKSLKIRGGGLIRILLSYGGSGTSFEEQEMIDYIKTKSRDYII